MMSAADHPAGDLRNTRTLRRRSPGPRRVVDIVAEESQRQGLPRRVPSTAAMKRGRVEQHRVARFVWKRDDVPGVAVGFDVGQPGPLRVRVIGAPFLDQIWIIQRPHTCSRSVPSWRRRPYGPGYCRFRLMPSSSKSTHSCARTRGKCTTPSRSKVSRTAFASSVIVIRRSSCRSHTLRCQALDNARPEASELPRELGHHGVTAAPASAG